MHVAAHDKGLGVREQHPMRQFIANIVDRMAPPSEFFALGFLVRFNKCLLTEMKMHKTIDVGDLVGHGRLGELPIDVRKCVAKHKREEDCKKPPS